MAACHSSVMAQFKILGPAVDRDTNYIYPYYDYINLYALSNLKNTSFFIKNTLDPKAPQSTKFKIIQPFTVGLAAQYKIFRIGYNFALPTKNHDFQNKSFDIQAAIWGRKFTFDAFGQHYQGFQIKSNDPSANLHGLRQDVFAKIYGGGILYVFNPKRYSFHQYTVGNEWQHKSAGTFLASISFFRNVLSSKRQIGITPTSDNQINQISTLKYFMIGPGLGYGYNFVFKRHFSLSASLIGKLYRNYERDYDLQNIKLKHNYWQPAYSGHIGLGYNNERWSINLVYLNAHFSTKTSLNQIRYGLDLGKGRLTYSYRFQPGKKLRKTLIHLDRLMLE